jgi:hypothetical protein
MLGKPAHLADERPKPIEVFVERFECMFARLLHSKLR